MTRHKPLPKGVTDAEADLHHIEELINDDLGIYAEGHSRKLAQRDGNSWFCMDLHGVDQVITELHDALGFSIEEIGAAFNAEGTPPDGWVRATMKHHNHSKCRKTLVRDEHGSDEIASYPRELCNWKGHQAACEEAGYCPVCQH